MPSSRSRDLFSLAQKYIPGGVNSPVRSFRSVGGEPSFIERGKGARVWDADGAEYIDYLCSWGPLVLGHAYPAVVAAITAAAEDGTSFGAPTASEVDLARAICQAFPSIEMVRLVNSGTEACMSALRLARAYTGRSKILKFAGCYHGHSDGLLVRAGSGALALGVPDSAGVPDSYASETLVADYNDLETMERQFEAHGDQIAAVIVEPVAGNMGVVPPEDGFLDGLRRITKQTGALLVMDEVITGFRVAYGGAQELYGIPADITCLGKIIGGGLPVGAYGGRPDIMEMVAPLGPVYQAGTLSGNPLAVRAGLATLEALKEPGSYQRLEGLASRLADGLSGAAHNAELDLTVNRVGSMLTPFFGRGPVDTQARVQACDADRYAMFFHNMLAVGVYLPPSAYEAAFVSKAHTEADVDRTVELAAQVFRDLP